jgi:phage replication-related protein YjqB (UPF0714/DUF867 family)
MTTLDAAVDRALTPEQQDLVDHPEHCSADPRALAEIGRAPGQQVRIRSTVDPSAVALFTVSDARDEASVGVVRMGRDGRRRFGTDETFRAVVDSVVPRSELTDAEADVLGDFVERLGDDGVHRGLIAIAPHGGEIERHTDTQAERVAERLARFGVSTWCCKGFGTADGGAFQRFHITSTDLDAAAFPALATVIGRGFRYAVAFHGFREEEVLIGGGVSFRLKAEIASAVENVLAGTGIRVRIAGPSDVFGGDSPRNIVQRLTAGGRGGVHIEQSLRARAEHALDIADAVAGVFAIRLDRPPRPGRGWWLRLRHWLEARRDRRRRQPGRASSAGR